MGEGGGLDPGGGFEGAVWASRPAKKSKDKTLGVFFHAALDVDTPGPFNTAHKSKNIEKMNLQKL